MPHRTLGIAVCITLSLILLGLIFFAPATGPRAREYITAGGSSGSLEAAYQENDALRAQLATFSALASEADSQDRHGITASVYSMYPLGGRSEITINAGSAQGVVTGDAVLARGILIGKVGNVSTNAATVVTIFDDSFSLTVRVASSGVNGLLSGGNYPVINSMPKDANIAAKDIVISAIPGFPYGLPLGVLGTPVLSSDSLFLTAPLETAYDLQNIKAVTVIPAS